MKQQIGKIYYDHTTGITELIMDEEVFSNDPIAMIDACTDIQVDTTQYINDSWKKFGETKCHSKKNAKNANKNSKKQQNTPQHAQHAGMKEKNTK